MIFEFLKRKSKITRSLLVTVASVVSGTVGGNRTEEESGELIVIALCYNNHRG